MIAHTGQEVKMLNQGVCIYGRTTEEEKERRREVEQRGEEE